MIRGFGLVGICAVALGGLGLAGAAAVNAAPQAAVTTTTRRPVPVPRWHLEGTHDGLESVAYGADGCSQLSHRLNETMVMTSRSAWRFEARYCGVLNSGNLWSGAGTFTMSNTTGSTLRGSFSNSAWLPSRGVPYVLRVTSGTGVVSGAHGTCVLSNHLAPTGTAGEQRQSGELSCDLFR